MARLEITVAESFRRISFHSRDNNQSQLEMNLWLYTSITPRLEFLFVPLFPRWLVLLKRVAREQSVATRARVYKGEVGVS
jgi:hypothetical protein